MPTTPPIIYVSWGGSGSNNTLEAAARTAKESSGDLIYLAVVDDHKFGDVAKATMHMLLEELEFILRSQTFAVLRQTGASEIEGRVIVKQGAVGEAIKDAVQASGASTVLVGGPLPLRADQTASEVLAQLQSEISVPVRMI